MELLLLYFSQMFYVLIFYVDECLDDIMTFLFIFNTIFRLFTFKNIKFIALKYRFLFLIFVESINIYILINFMEVIL